MCKPPLLDNQAPADEADEPEDLQTASEDSALKHRLDLQTGEDGLSEEEAARRLLQHGRNELPDLRTPKWRIFLSHFTGIMPGTIIIAIIIEGLLQEWPDMSTLTALLLLNGFVGFFEDMRAGDAVAALKASLKPEAQVKRAGAWRKADASQLVPGDRVALAAGANVPADILLGRGMQVQVDQAALTGESLPVSLGEGSLVKMGSTIVSGETEGLVAHTGVNTFFGKTAALIGSTHDVGNFQKVILRITRALLLFSSLLVTAAVTYLSLTFDGEGYGVWPAVSFGAVLLVASIPIAMQVVCTATMALGSRLLAAKKAIVARLASIEQLAGMTVLCSDKTGTLTLNKMVLQEVLSYAKGADDAAILALAALATRWKEPPKDALDTLVLRAECLDTASLDRHEQLDFTPFDPKLRRTEATLRGPDGGVFDVVKGAPDVVLRLCDEANRSSIGAVFAAKVEELAQRGIRALAVARRPEGGGMEMVGMLTFLDPPRPDTKRTIERAMQQGVVVKMITGDHGAIARETARALGMGDEIGASDSLPTILPGEEVPRTLGRDYGAMIEKSDGFAQVFPEHKFLIVEALRQRGHSVGMTGDGVNDAPALKKADVGIAVEGATDAARAASDLVLTEPGLSVIVDAIVIARCIFQRMKNYVIYRVACTFQLLLFFFVAVFAFHPRQYDAAHQLLPGHPNVYPLPTADLGSGPGGGDSACSAVQCSYSDIGDFGSGTDDSTTCGGVQCSYGFRMSDTEVGLAIPSTFNLPVVALVVIVILNDATIISIAYDHVVPSPLPERWNLPALFLVAGWIGLVACGSSLLLLHWALSSEDPGSPIRRMGVRESLSYGQVVAMMYLKISLSDWWTIFAARTQSFFFTRAPSKIVFAAASVATLASTGLAVRWPFPAERYDERADLDAQEPDSQLIGLGLEHVLFTWAFTLVWFLIQDVCKVLLYKLLYTFDVSGIRTEAEANAARRAKNEAILGKQPSKRGARAGGARRKARRGEMQLAEMPLEVELEV